MKRLWLPGWQCQSHSFTALWQALAVEGESVLSFENTQQTREQWLAQQAELITEPTTLIGWSLGGMLACELAALNPLVTQVRVICANTQFAGGPGLAEVVAQNFMMRYQKNPSVTRKRFAALVDSQNPDEVADYLLAGDHLHTLQWLYQSQLEPLKLSADVQVLLGETDLLVPVETAQQAWQALGAQVTRTASEHSLPVKQADVVAQWITKHG